MGFANRLECALALSLLILASPSESGLAQASDVATATQSSPLLFANGLGVPIGGFRPQVGFGLTNEFKTDNQGELFFFADNSSLPGGSWLGANGAAHYDIALLDSGAQVSLLTEQASLDFDLFNAGFKGTEQISIGGATGMVQAEIEDPLGIYATGLSNRTSTQSLMFDLGTMRGQTTVSMVTAPADFPIGNVIGLPMVSQYTTVIRNDRPQIFDFDGATVRTPDVEFLPLGSGAAQGITRRVPLQLSPGDAFLLPPAYIFNITNILDDPPLPLTENPSAPTNVPGGLFLNVDVQEGDSSLDNVSFFLDTGAQVSVVSELKAVQLGFDPASDQPDFEIEVVGSGGTFSAIPGFFADTLTIDAIGGSLTLQDVPLIVFDITNPGDPGNVVDGLIGTNIFRGRNLVIDPNPSIGGGGVGPSLYISDFLLESNNWVHAAPSGAWNVNSNWSGTGTPGDTSVANLINVSGTAQQAVVSTEVVANEVLVAGANGATMTLVIEEDSRLTTFGILQIETGGVVEILNGRLSAQSVELLGGSLTGEGVVEEQVENRSGVIAPGGDSGTIQVRGALAQRSAGVLEIDLDASQPELQNDAIDVTDSALLSGTLRLSLADDVSPNLGDQFQILSADSISGMFELVEGMLAHSDLSLAVLYSESEVLVQAVLPADFNLDGTINDQDLASLASNWQRPDAMTWIEGDANGDGQVDDQDLAILAAHWNDPTIALTVVPEPTSGSLLIAGILLTWCGRRRCKLNLRILRP